MKRLWPKDTDHPLYRIVWLLITAFVILGCVYIGATEFDKGELEGWALIVGSIAGIDWVRQTIRDTKSGVKGKVESALKSDTLTLTDLREILEKREGADTNQTRTEGKK